MKKRFVILIIVFILVGSIVCLNKANKWIQGEVGAIVKTHDTDADKLSNPIQTTETTKPKRRMGEVIRKTRLAPERTFELSIFYQSGEEIARHKVSRKGVVYDHVGKIPNGKVKFINETEGTYGAEIYWDNLRHGPSRTKYNNGQLKIEANYQFGKLITRKEYYIDGLLKMEADYSDARGFTEKKNTGIGKMYSRDGKVKFEWYMVASDPVGYYKSYDRKGNLTTTLYFDEFGNERPIQENSAGKGTILSPEILP